MTFKLSESIASKHCVSTRHIKKSYGGQILPVYLDRVDPSPASSKEQFLGSCKTFNVTRVPKSSAVPSGAIVARIAKCSDTPKSLHDPIADSRQRTQARTTVVHLLAKELSHV
jgi:hypothetical protein